MRRTGKSGNDLGAKTFWRFREKSLTPARTGRGRPTNTRRRRRSNGKERKKGSWRRKGGWRRRDGEERGGAWWCAQAKELRGVPTQRMRQSSPMKSAMDGMRRQMSNALRCGCFVSRAAGAHVASRQMLSSCGCAHRSRRRHWHKAPLTPKLSFSKNRLTFGSCLRKKSPRVPPLHYPGDQLSPPSGRIMQTVIRL